jgi:hypothetical protein
VVNADTGADVGVIATNGISGGTFLLNQIGVADDGNIYAANLVPASATSPFKIYRWSNEGVSPTTVYSGNPSGGPSIRYGDAIDVRGSGINTEIIASTGGANSTNLIAVFRPTDASLNTFTVKSILISGVGLTDFAKGIGFAAGNRFIGKNSGNANLRLCTYDWDTATGALVSTYTVSTALTAVNMDPVNELVAGVATANATSPHQLIVYDVSSGAAVQLLATNFPPPGTAGANVVGGIDYYAGRIIGVDAKNGVRMLGVTVDNTPVPVSITQAPQSTNFLERGYGSLTVNATGTKPISYQWFFNNTLMTNETNASLLFTNLQVSAAGSYTVLITNIVGMTTPPPAVLTVDRAVFSLALTQLWQILPGERPYLTDTALQRGLAYNPDRNHLILVSRAPTNGIYVLDANTGALLHTMNLAGLSGGTFVVNMAGCSQDGQVFVANLTTSGPTTAFKIYGWNDDDNETTPHLVYSGDPGGGVVNRWGDNFDIRGSGFSVDAIAASRTGTVATLISEMGFGSMGTASLITAPGIQAGDLGLSVAFGSGDTFWGKATGGPFRQLDFSGTLLNTISAYSNIAAIAVDPVNNFLAGMALDSPDNIRLLNMDGLPGIPVELDTDFFPIDNANPLGVGQIRFAPNRLYALSGYNGLIAFSLAPKLRKATTPTTMTLSWDGIHTLQASPTVTTGWTNVPNAVSGHTINLSAPQIFYRLLD